MSADTTTRTYARARSPKTLRRSQSLFGAIKTLISTPLAWFQSPSDFEDIPGKRRRNPQVLEPEREEGQRKRQRVRSPSPSTGPPHQRQLRAQHSPSTGSTIPGCYLPRCIYGIYLRAAVLARRDDFTYSQSFGPTPEYHAREATEPPPVSTLKSNPAFVKPPPASTPLTAERTMTLGSITESQQRLMPGTEPIPTGTTQHIQPSKIKDKRWFDLTDKKEKSVAPEDGAGLKPYAGRGGVKKMLAKRRAEEEEEVEKEHENEIVDDSRDQEEGEDAMGLAESAEEISQTPPLGDPEFAPGAPTTGPSLLRVGRTGALKHAPSALRAKNTFSALYDDEDEDMESETQEPPKPAPMYKPPAGFSFAKDTSITFDKGGKDAPIASLPFSLSSTSRVSSSAPTNQAAANRTSDSFTSGFMRTDSGGSSTVIATDAAGSEPDARAMAPSKPVMQTVPQISLTPATPLPQASFASTAPKALPKLSEPGASGSGQSTAGASEKIPDFFSKSSIFSKPTATIAPPPPLVFNKPGMPPSATNDASNTAANGTSAPPVWGASTGDASSMSASGIPAQSGATGTTPVTIQAATSPFGKPTTATPDTASSFGALDKGKGVDRSGIGSSGFAAPSQPAEPSTAAPSSFTPAAPEKPAVAPSASSFSFAPAKPADASVAVTPSPFGFSATAKSADSSVAPTPVSFSFATPAKAEASAATGAPSIGLAPPAKVNEPSNSSPFVFGPSTAKAPEQPKPSPFGNLTGFGAPSASNSSGGGEAAKSMFAFGPTSTSPAPTPNGASVEAAKPLFGTGSSSPFAFEQTSSTAPKEAPDSSKPSFSFASASPTPPGTANGASMFGFGSSAQSATSTSPFGGSGASNGPNDSNKFSFATATPAMPITPPKNDQEVSMDESPIRGSGMDTNGNGNGKEPLKVTTSFSFSQPTATSSPFGQTAQSGSTFAFGPTASSSNPFGAKPAENKTEAPNTPTSFGGFGTSASTGPGFSFTQKAPEASQASASTNPFGATGGFGQSATTPSTTSTFAFGPSAASGSGFGQPSANSTSNPVSPFTSAPSYGFSNTPTSTTAPSNPFGFTGSQPASPATSNAGLPSSSSNTGGAFSFASANATPAASPASPFGASAAAPATNGTPGFTMGSAPPPASRPVKKLPSRRGGKR
ncbi:hypothetical protein POSPLADRAFT_1064878 [Postia placenta MAD-698-R-SB12]|uniref:Uncharacterized protein n=1 Tax=Postia placenta MAD-698-R-SB12 TaxID=670580 RepID=A0A1X6N839_9APHY|nr:hypothetical protein POSPLADRAFT_1064878 [Postia placenta MAD-698-R-SB12]OSX64662.1 hypothetical protein POSPLADRAFT_1064878 [Postia placenta MAD-698-R-SB12]